MAQAIEVYAGSVEALGIGERDGSVVIRLELGSNQPAMIGDRFDAFNLASGEKWGVIEATEISSDSCICSVFDRINVEFWQGLEIRMRTDAAPPTGIKFSREVPENILVFLDRLIQHLGG